MEFLYEILIFIKKLLFYHKYVNNDITRNIDL